MTDPKAAQAAVASRYGIPVCSVREVLTTALSELQAREDLAPRPNCMTPTAPLDLPLGSVKIARCDSECYVAILREVDPKAIAFSEPESSIRQHASYEVYKQWAGLGWEAPPITVFEGPNSQWVSCNRRRTLVHQELGLSIKAWFEPHNPETGLPLKVKDVQQAYQQQLQHGIRPRADATAATP